MRNRLSSAWQWVGYGTSLASAIAAGAAIAAARRRSESRTSVPRRTIRRRRAVNRVPRPRTARLRGAATDTLELSDAQLEMISVGAVSEHAFPLEREAVGSIDFNEDMAAQVFPPYQGRIVQLYAKIGDNVKRGQPLLTIESPDLIQADSNLIAAAGVLDLTTHALERAKQLYEVQGMAEKDLQQAISDQQTAEGRAQGGARRGRGFRQVCARDRPHGEVSHDRSVPGRAEPDHGPYHGAHRGSRRLRATGQLPAPYTVADLSRIWMNASVTESDMPLVRKGQPIHVTVMAFPGRVFEGEISTVGATVDPQLHRGLVRAEIEDSKHELLPGMFASFVIVTGEPERSPAVPLDGVVREGDGTMTVWFTTDRHRFTKRTVKIGLQHAGYDQILEGVRPGEQIVTRGAVFLDNLLGGES